jgi:hypothetical protein
MKAPEYGDKLKSDPRWEMISTGGGFSAWWRPVVDGASATEPGWLIVHGEGHAPPEERRGPVDLYFEVEGSSQLHARCKGVADAVALADRFEAVD